TLEPSAHEGDVPEQPRSESRCHFLPRRQVPWVPAFQPWPSLVPPSLEDRSDRILHRAQASLLPRVEQQMVVVQRDSPREQADFLCSVKVGSQVLSWPVSIPRRVAFGYPPTKMMGQERVRKPCLETACQVGRLCLREKETDSLLRHPT